MKKKIASLMAFPVLLSFLLSSFVFAGEIKTKDIPVGSSGKIQMTGTIEPTILSVTMPSYIPFNISNSVPTVNKAISPRINIKNHSSIPVEIDIVQTYVDLSEMTKTTWSDTGLVSDNQIAIGFKKEDQQNVMPSDLYNVRWLAANKAQAVNILNLDSNGEGAIYVVSAMGDMVTEQATFHVTPTFVVNRALTTTAN